jgi:site-specific DNA recombinase
MTTKNIKAGIYCRISDDRGGEGLGVERQRQDCIALAGRLGWAVMDTYADNDLSAYSGKPRPDWQRLLDDVSTGRINAILAWHQDRINRSPTELEQLIDFLQRYQVAVQTVTAGEIDLSSPTGRAVARTVGAWCRQESEHKSTRIKRQRLADAHAGGTTNGAYRPFGYKMDRLTVNRSEAKIVQDMMGQLLGGETLLNIAKGLNARGITTSSGNPWRGTSVGRTLTQARIAGWRAVPVPQDVQLPYGGEFLAPAQWPAIVSRGEVEQARALLRDETTHPGSSARWLLHGIVVCGTCGSPMSSALRDDHPDWRRRYACTRSTRLDTQRCGSISITTQIEGDLTTRLHNAVRQGLIRRILAAPTEPDIWSPTTTVTRKIEMGLRRLDADRDDGLITRKDWVDRRTRLRRRALAPGRTPELVPPAELATMTTRPKFVAAWESATMRRRRSLVHTLAAEITVIALPQTGGVYNPARLVTTWRA